MKYLHMSKWFYGQKLSRDEIQVGYISYATLARTFDAILNNSIMGKTYELGEWEVVNGSEVVYLDERTGNIIDEDEYLERGGDEEYKEFYQYYIISESGYQILSECTNEVVWYNEEIDMYIWGVDHFGTSWGAVYTDIKIGITEEYNG